MPPESPGTVPVTAMVFTLDEEIHLPACLESLRWCGDVVVVDSFSTDRTEEIAGEGGARFFQHEFEGFGSQRSWALEHTSPKHSWVLILDADERVPPALAEEIAEVVGSASGTVGAYRLRRRLYMWGRWLRYSALYPTWVVRLVHRERVRFLNRGHAETEEVHGEIGELRNDLIDENLKGIDEWFSRQNRYARKEAEYELSLERGRGRAGFFSGDPLARRETLKSLARGLPGRPFWYFLYSYLLRGGFLEGRDGLTFCVMKAIYQQMITVKKYDLRRGEEEVPG